MSDTSTENSALVNLTDEQRDFLKQCDEDFANRFTDSDAEYVEVRDRKKSVPPIEDQWNPFPFRDRDGYRDRGRYRDRERDYRDRDHRDRDGWRPRYGRDNYHQRYDHRRRDDHYPRYRSNYHSNYYRK